MNKEIIEKYSPINILKNYVMGNNITKLKKKFSNDSFKIKEFINFYITECKIPIEQKIYFINGLWELFNLVYFEYGDKNQIQFKFIINFILNKLKKLEILSFQLNKQELLLNHDLSIKDERFKDKIHFEAPLILESNKHDYLSI